MSISESRKSLFGVFSHEFTNLFYVIIKNIATLNIGQQGAVKKLWNDFPLLQITQITQISSKINLYRLV